MGLVLLGLSAAFGYWYHFVGFLRISPDFAEAGWSSTWWDWFEAGVLLAVAIPALAYRLSVDSSDSIEMQFTNQRNPVLHQSLLVTFLLGLAAIFHSLCCLLFLLFDDYTVYYSISALQLFIWTITDVDYYMEIAVTLLSLQLLRKHWKSSAQSCSLRIARVKSQKFLLASLVLIAVLLLSIPTITAFSFAFWVGPWSWPGSLP
ncbi:MAG: hypothetical protein GXP24_05360 [Planctomycetes bacterium]|nr:hypothetical protein [Planctomycetota bacterium]